MPSVYLFRCFRATQNACVNIDSVKIFFLSQSSFQSVPCKVKILNVVSKRHSNYLTRVSLGYRNYISPWTKSVSVVSARPHPLIVILSSQKWDSLDLTTCISLLSKSQLSSAEGKLFLPEIKLDFLW